MNDDSVGAENPTARLQIVDLIQMIARGPIFH